MVYSGFEQIMNVFIGIVAYFTEHKTQLRKDFATGDYFPNECLLLQTYYLHTIDQRAMVTS